MTHTDLCQLADLAMQERGLDPRYSALAAQQAERACLPAVPEGVADLRALPWCSIDNGQGQEVTSKDLDQLTLAQPGVDGNIRLWVAVADVDALVPKNCPIDEQARRNTTTVYTAGKNYPMIHPRLSEDLTSLNPHQDRLAVVSEILMTGEGELVEYDFRRALVHNQAALNYEGVGLWLQGEGPLPDALQSGSPDLVASLRLQDRLAQALKLRRQKEGSLNLASQEARAQLDEQGQVTNLSGQLRNRATELIENIMIANNGCVSHYLRSRQYPTLQRIVRQPKFWQEIVELAASCEPAWELPTEADSPALARFLDHQRKHDPIHFPDLSLQVLKLLGRGEYVVDLPGQPLIGHFGLAVREYSHSTAPNRRYPDLLSQRLLKAALAQQVCPYRTDELDKLARHCTLQEGMAQKVERQSQKSAAALMLSKRVGETFEAIVSGQNRRAQWVRLLAFPIEGKLLGQARLGQRISVKLAAVNVEKGFIDFRLTSG